MRLHIRLALVFGLLLTGVAIALGSWIAKVAERYQSEVSQRLNAGIAMYVTDELALLDANGVNQSALKELARRVMTVNPSAEVYLLDTRGNIVATLIPWKKLHRTRVSLSAIETFLSDAQRRPIYGEDPTDIHRTAVFSVAPVKSGDTQLGYLYVVLGGDRFGSVADALRGSYSLKMGAIVIAGLLAITLIVGIGLFAMLTLPLRQLTSRMRKWSTQMEPVTAGTANADNDRDEIAALGQQFDSMAAQIEHHLEQIRTRDAQRRELIAGISHDLRTPLASLHGYLETVLLKAEQLPTATRRQYLEIARRHSEQLQRLISALFELSKLEAGAIHAAMEAFSLGELLQDIALRFRLRAQQLGVEILTEVDPKAPLVMGDVALVERIFENLLDNALHHTPHGGHIRLTMHAAEGRMRICVADSGRGIAAEDIPHVFDLYYRGRQQRGDSGSGLGLAIVRRIVELHGQTISLSSDPGMGTSVEFSLPFADTSTANADKPAIAAA